ncbi:hypothetical protein CHS0354_038474 [Potamilus streckersoni]|uniref:Uncharacterized protein n=1 Tax=Potamilus streckersoni TaxID=2493646 RepID=A0AAE0S638_9BIVA|nr:hypothetical protein CHS0354_038474 [Potamilus streckersoni]
MAASEVERLKELLPKISVRIAGKTDGLVKNMKKLGIIKDDTFLEDANPNRILEKVAESRSFKIMEHLKDILTKEGFKNIVLEIEGKLAQTSDSNDDACSDDVASDSYRDDSESKSGSVYRVLRKMRDEMNRELQELKHEVTRETKEQAELICREVKEMRKEISEEAKECKKREETLLKMITKLEIEKDQIEKEVKEIRATGIDEAASETLLLRCHELERKHNQLLQQMNKKEKIELALRKRNQRLETEIAQTKLTLISMQIKKNPTRRMYSNFATPDRQTNDEKNNVNTE